MTPEEHYKEVVKLDMDKFDKKAPKFDYYDLLDFAESYYKKQLTLTDVSKSFTYKDISKVAEELANDYSSDKKDPVWRDIRQDGIKAIQAFVSKHL